MMTATKSLVKPPGTGDLNLRLFIPRYKVMSTGPQLGGKNFVVQLRRKHVKLPLFVLPFYMACYTAFMKRDLNPEERFVRMHYEKDYYSYSNGKRRKNVKQRSTIVPRLSWYKQVDNYKGSKAVYYLVTARFTDPSSSMNYGFTVLAGAKNVKLYITKEMLERIDDPEKFDWAGFFTDFLEKELEYHKAVYVVSCKKGTIHRLHALQGEMKTMLTGGEFY